MEATSERPRTSRRPRALASSLVSPPPYAWPWNRISRPPTLSSMAVLCCAALRCAVTVSRSFLAGRRPVRPSAWPAHRSPQAERPPTVLESHAASGAAPHCLLLAWARLGWPRDAGSSNWEYDPATIPPYYGEDAPITHHPSGQAVHATRAQKHPSSRRRRGGEAKVRYEYSYSVRPPLSAGKVVEGGVGGQAGRP